MKTLTLKELVDIDSQLIFLVLDTRNEYLSYLLPTECRVKFWSLDMLHPKLHKEKLNRMVEMGIKTFVATNCPTVILASPIPCALVRVTDKRNGEFIFDRFTEIENKFPTLTVNSLLSSELFNNTDVFSAQSQGDIRTEDTYKEMLNRNDVTKELKTPLSEEKKQELKDILRLRRSKLG